MKWKNLLHKPWCATVKNALLLIDNSFGAPAATLTPNGAHTVRNKSFLRAARRALFHSAERADRIAHSISRRHRRSIRHCMFSPTAGRRHPQAHHSSSRQNSAARAFQFRACPEWSAFQHRMYVFHHHPVSSHPHRVPVHALLTRPSRPALQAPSVCAILPPPPIDPSAFWSADTRSAPTALKFGPCIAPKHTSIPCVSALLAPVMSFRGHPAQSVRSVVRG